MKEKEVDTHVRMPASLVKAVATHAEDDGRTINKEIVALLKEALEARRPKLYVA